MPTIMLPITAAKDIFVIASNVLTPAMNAGAREANRASKTPALSVCRRLKNPVLSENTNIGSGTIVTAVSNPARAPVMAVPFRRQVRLQYIKLASTAAIKIKTPILARSPTISACPRRRRADEYVPNSAAETAMTIVKTARWDRDFMKPVCKGPGLIFG